MARKASRKGLRPAVSKALATFISDKLSAANATQPLAMQATAWFADQQKVDSGEIFAGRSVESFIKLVYRIRSSRNSKTRRVAQPTKTAKPVAPKTLTPKEATTSTMTMLRQALDAYEAYLALAPRLHQADEFLRKCGLTMVVVNGKPTLQKS